MPVARVTDVHVCPICGPNMIVKGSPMHTADGLPVARMGDMTACGASIVLASFTHTAD
ncbi:MAG: PAAR domain-containing protein, partial [Paracoccaceae bacterium]